MCNHYLRIAQFVQQPSAKARNQRPSKPGIDSGLQHLNTVKEHIAPHQQSAAHGHLSVPQTFPWPAAARSPRYHSWNCLKPSIGPLHLLRHHSPRGPSSTAPWICLKHIPSSFPSHGLTVGKTEDFCHHYQHIPLDAIKSHFSWWNPIEVRILKSPLPRFSMCIGDSRWFVLNAQVALAMFPQSQLRRTPGPQGAILNSSEGDTLERFNGYSS